MFSVDRLKAFATGFVSAKLGGRLSREGIDRLQRRRFRALQRALAGRSPFYAPYLGAPLDSYPMIDKATHVANFDVINTAGLARDGLFRLAIQSEQTRDFKPDYNGFSVGLSSGTSGNRGLFVTSPREQAIWAGYIIGKMLPLSLRKHRVALFLRANNDLYESSNNPFLQFQFFDLIEGIDIHIEALEAFDPTILIAPANILCRIVARRPAIKPLKVISAAEVLEDNDKIMLEAFFRQTVHQLYQCTEGFLAATCRYGNLHLNEDIVLIEKQWIDKASGRFSPVVTDLMRTTQPIIRYLLDDILIENPEPCSCGSNMTRLNRIEGRKDDVLLLQANSGDTVEVFPDFIRNTIIASCDTLQQYQVIQEQADMLRIYLAPLDATVQQRVATALDKLFMRLDVTPPHYDFQPFEANAPVVKRRRVQRKFNG